VLLEWDHTTTGGGASQQFAWALLYKNLSSFACFVISNIFFWGDDDPFIIRVSKV